MSGARSRIVTATLALVLAAYPVALAVAGDGTERGGEAQQRVGDGRGGFRLAPLVA